MKLYISIFILIFVLVSDSFSQKNLPFNSSKLIDSALNLMNLRYSDIWLPNDMNEIDEHRLSVIQRMFNKPLASIDFTDTYSKSLVIAEPMFMDKLISKIVSDLEYSQFKLFNYDDNYPIKYVNDHLNTKIDSLAGFMASLVIRDYVPLIIQTTSILATDVLYRDDSRSNTLFDYADSLIFFDDYSKEQNVYETKAKELAFFDKSKAFFAHLNILENTKVFEMGVSLYKELYSKLKSNLEIKQMLRDSIKTIVINTDYGKIGIGGKGNDIYKGDFIFIFDIGGNDTYILPDYKKDDARNYPVRVIIDIEGNDIYEGGNYSIAGSYKGINLLFDMHGNDKYTAGNVSLGGAILGLSILHDFEGDDYYKSSNLSQGAGAYGIGLLIDKTGNDTYNCQTLSQGFGFVRGFGALADTEGNDIYISSSTIIDNIRSDEKKLSFSQGAALGYRPVASGGIGILADGDGDDTYISDMYGQGSAYWYGIGGLIDFKGNDIYKANQYAQGAGVHFAFGVLNDYDGNDTYISKAVSQGSGHDFAFGSLLDTDGNDRYIADELSIAAGNANGISLLLDKNGNDTYSVSNSANSLGYSDFRRNWCMLGLFIDGSGSDVYSEKKNNDLHYIKSFTGAFVDFEFSKDEKKRELKREESNTPISSILDSLFVQATASLSKFQTGVAPARAKITSFGKKGFDFLLSKFNSPFARERNAVEDMVNKMYPKENEYISKCLIDSLLSADYSVYSLSARILGQNKEKKALSQLMLRARSANWKDRALAAQHIGEIGVSVLSDSIAFLLFDQNQLVRARTAYSLASLFHYDILGEIAPALSDSFQVVRYNAMAGLLRNKPYKYEFIKEIFLGNLKEESVLMLIPMLAIIDFNPADYKSFVGIISKQSKKIRAAAYKEIINSGNKKWKDIYKLLIKNESDSDLKTYLGKLNEK